MSSVVFPPASAEAPQPFDCACIVGIGLIGGSIARALAATGTARRIVVLDSDPAHCARALELGIAQAASTDPAAVVPQADLVVVAVPVAQSGAVAAVLAPHLANGAIVMDTGSVKQAVVEAMAPVLPAHAIFIPAHPIAGTEHSGPDAGFAELFQGRWCILTPEPEAPPEAVLRLAALWRAFGSQVATMPARHHDRVLAITSHLPHLIAYTIVGTATDLEDDTKSDVIRFSASGFRDFTRIAASDPTMWRDIFLNNREAVLEIIQRFTEDLTALQRAIRRGEGETLFDRFAQTRAIRRGVIEARQADVPHKPEEENKS